MTIKPTRSTMKKTRAVKEIEMWGVKNEHGEIIFAIKWWTVGNTMALNKGEQLIRVSVRELRREK